MRVCRCAEDLRCCGMEEGMVVGRRMDWEELVGVDEEDWWYLGEMYLPLDHLLSR